MGNQINLDPASSQTANEFVGAENFYTEADNGLIKAWFGNVWLNWPYGRRENKLWSERLIRAYESGEIEQACTIGFASTSERWFQRLAVYPYIKTSKRVSFIDPATGEQVKGSTKGSVVFYLGPNLIDFYLAFRDIGQLSISPDASQETMDQFLLVWQIHRQLHHVKNS